MKRLSVILTLMAVVFSADSAFALSLVLENETGKELHELYFAPAGQTDWGPDQLGDDVVPNGGTFTLSKIEKGKYDVLFVDENGAKCDIRDVDFSSSEVFKMTKSVIKGCQEASDQGEDEE